ncbi:MAG TPA: acetate/propionate family kinase [Stellaceae bacterium]|nr:acetate/propionate family kinase [Stellaceae bacterium]
MAQEILCFNAGSSSLKFALYGIADTGLRRVLAGEIEEAGERQARFHAADAEGRALPPPDLGAAGQGRREDLLAALLAWIEGRGSGEIAAAGHRIVHGGTAFAAPILIDGGVLESLERLVPLAPLHQPHNLAPIRVLRALRPRLPQIAAFDTAFHHGRPAVTTRFALPREFADAGVRRYGFHGLSYEYIAQALPTVAPEIARGRAVVAHLGNGASLCAMQDGKSVDTTMSFTALDGLVMGTRCGALDPGVVLYLLRERGLDAGAIEDLLYRRSGLLGVSGVAGDMRTLLASRDPRAEEAVALFVFRIVRELGALAATMGGLDGLVFTAGIGEHAAEIRRRVCDGAKWLGVALDAAANEAGGPRITRPKSRVSAWVIPTDEDLMIARHVRDLLAR